MRALMDSKVKKNAHSSQTSPVKSIQSILQYD